jgi:ligand-binding sensor domain-containing protein/signal transduction histidine kinase/DNA-binding response OmpR family regulator
MKYFLICFFLTTSFLSKSQPVKFNALTVGNGLSQNSVLCIAQDSRGFMWFGTRYGLNKYDSQRFTVYKNAPDKPESISSNYITALLCDKEKNLWVGTNNGLNLYDDKKDCFIKVSLAPASVINKQWPMVSCIYEDKTGRKWVTSGNSLYLLTGNKGHISIRPIISLSKNNMRWGTIHCVFQDHEGIIWVGTSMGALKLSEKHGDFAFEPLVHSDDNPNSISNNQVFSIVEDSENTIWAGTLVGGLNQYNRETNSFTHFRHSDNNPNSLVNNNIRKILTDNKGNLWIGTQEGVSILDTKTKTFTNCVNDPWNKNSLSQNSVHSLYKDNVGNMWVGTFFGGVNSYFYYNTPFTIYSNKSSKYRLSNNVVSSIVEDEKMNLWIGTEGGGLNYLNRATGQSTYYFNNPEQPLSLGANLVKVVYKDKAGNIWAGTHGGGLNVFNPQSATFSKFLYENHETLGSEVTCLLEDSQGLFWVGTERAGIKLFKKKGTLLIPYSDGDDITRAMGNISILSVIETADKNIWVGGPSGLFIIRNNQVKPIAKGGGKPSYYVNSIFEDRDKNIWIGTYYQGLIKYNQQGQIKAIYEEKDGLPDNNVLGILQDDEGALWISTGNGLCRFDINRHTFNTYTETDGLAGNVFNNNSYYKSKTGEMFFGGYNGFTGFYPDQIEVNKKIPPVYFTGLKLFDKWVGIDATDNLLTKDISYTSDLTLKHDQNVFTLTFAILNYIKPDKNRYRYKMDSFDEQWHETTNPSVVYTNVPPGQYRLIVQGANNDNFWSNSATLKINILPPFWKTWWAYSLYTLLSIAIVFFVVRYFFLRALLKKNDELTQLKLNFFTNISHEIRTHLSLIIGPAENLMLEEKKDPYARQQLVSIKNNSESLLQLVNELMDFRKAETGHLSLHIAKWNIVPFIESIFSSFYDSSVSKNIQADCVSSVSEMEIYFDKEQLEKVFYNLLSNAFKFTPDGGFISLSIEDKPDFIEVSVTNSGKGISKENMEKLFDNYFQEEDYGKENTGYGIGLALSKSIVELHQGNLSVISQPQPDSDGYITCFKTTLLKGKSHFAETQLTYPLKETSNTADAIFTNSGTTEILRDLTGNELLDKQVILLVEDNFAIRAFIKESLTDQYEILESPNGAEGLAAALQHTPDLIISDVMMPEMDGLTLCSRLKTDERTSHIPVILLTAKNTVAHHVSGLQNGADIYLTKPFSIQVLKLQIFNLLNARQKLWLQFSKQLKPHGGLSQNIGDKLLQGINGINHDPIPLHPLDRAFIDKVTNLVNDSLGNPQFGIALLSKQVAMSQPVLFKKIKAITGLSANEFVKSLRLKKAAELLLENRYTVYEIAYMVGYESSKYFSREFKKHFDKNPTAYAAFNHVHLNE